MTTLDPRAGTLATRALRDDLTDERALVAAFFELLETDPQPRIVSWNGRGFDLPVLRFRGMKHGVAAPAFHRDDDGGRDAPGYGNRYLARHVDVMDQLSSFGAAPRVGLAAASELLELPAKSFLRGEVYEHWIAGEHDRIVEYCKLDTLTTMLVFLAWSVHTGALPRATLASWLPSLRELLAAQTHAEWAPIAAKLAAWPPWLDRAR